MEKEKKESKAPSKQIIGLLHNGEENALTARDLATSTGLSVRDITLQIARERQAGAVILSSGKGYFLPSNLAFCADDEQQSAEHLSCRTKCKSYARKGSGAVRYFRRGG